MPLGIISSDDFESELANCNSDSSIHNSNSPRDLESDNSNESEPIDNAFAEVINIKSGRGSGNTAVPEALRKVVGETSVISGRKEALDLAGMFGISKSSVSAYKEGAHSTASINEPNTNTKAHIDASKLRVSKRARHKLNLALTHITDDKLAEAKVGEIASVAKAMAGVIKDLEPDTNEGKNKSNIPFVVFAPIIKNELSYEVVHAKDDY